MTKYWWSKRCVTALWLLTALLALLPVDPSEASLGRSLGRPIKSVYRKIRNVGHRNIERLVRHRNRRDGRASPISRVMRDTRPDDYQAMCVFSRGPSLKRSPALYYFSSEVNSPGCEVDIEIELKSIDDQYLQLDDQFARASINNKLLATRFYSPTRPTYVLVHGFMADWTGNWLCNTKDLVLNRTAANVFILDWSGGSKPMLPLDYGASVSNTEYVADLMSRFLALLIDMSGQRDASRFHMIGHSLGAHICGFVGYALDGQVGQITGLDPAGPCFTTNSLAESNRAEATGEMHKNKRRLSPESARLVLALHTDVTLFGLDENCAHYDIYVNGGSRQPKCPAVNPVARLGDLLHLNIGTAFNLNLVCCHSYAHKLLDSFVDFTSWGKPAPSANELVVSQNRNSATNQDKCYPMAYKCPDWAAFQAGECGFCHDNDSHCVYTGISLYDYQVRKSVRDSLEYRWADPTHLMAGAAGDDDENGEDDTDFNGEDNNQADPRQDLDSDDLRRRQLAQLGQHFYRAAADRPTCVFQYQVVVAVEHGADLAATADTRNRPYFYVHLPLERSGRLHDAAGQRLQDRLVQVSHRVDPRSPVYRNLRLDYMGALSGRLQQQSEQLAGAYLNLDFYTALITFRQAPSRSCPPGGSGAPPSKDSWQLCEPLANVQTARLWSSSVARLQGVQWVALNFMSGLTHDQRMQRSYALLKSPSAPIRSRDQIDRADQAKLGALKPSTRSARSVVTATKCLLSVLDLANITNAKHAYRCKRSSSELKYAVELRPVRL